MTHTSLNTQPNALTGLALRVRKQTARRLGAVALGLTLATSVAACGDDTEAKPAATAATAAKSVEVSDAWVRSTEGAKDTSVSAAFMVLDNTGSNDVELVGASSDVAERTELHEMERHEGKSMMNKIEGGLELRAGSGQLLQPGGNHVMLMDLTQELAPGDEVKVVLEFSDGSTHEVVAPVKAFTEEEGHYHAPGTGEHSH